MYPVYTVPAGDTLPVFFHTFDSNDPSASVTLTGLAVTDIEIYKDGSVTQRASDAGYTLLDTDGIDFDGITGIHGFSIDTGDNTDAGFYTVGAWYHVVVSSVTVDAATVNFVACAFRIVAAEGVAGVPDVNVTHVGDTAQTARDLGASVLLSSGTGTGQVSLSSGTVTVGTNSDKTGYSLAATGLDAISQAATGMVEIAKAVWDRVLSGATHNIASSAGRRLRSLQDNGLYALAAVWVDEVNGTSTGTISYEDATVTNRANDFDNAQTVAAALFLNRIFVANGNSITLTATISNFEIGVPGGNWTLALGGQAITGCDINDAVVSGTYSGTDPHFHNCEVGATSGTAAKFYGCGFTGTFTVTATGNFDLVDCYSLVAGASAPVIDLGAAVGATNISIRRWSGGLTLNNVQTGDVVSVDVISGGTITVNGTGGTVVIRGMCNVVDGSSGSVTITQTSVVNMTKINAEADTAISDAALATAASLATAQADLDILTGTDGATLATSQANYAPATAAQVGTPVDTDIATDIANVAARTLTAAPLAQLTQNLNNCIAGTASGTPTTTTMVSNVSVTVNDQFNGRIITFDDDTTTAALRRQSTDITACTAASNTLTFTALTTAPVSGDTFTIT